MARKTPFPKREREICKRLRSLRESLNLSRVEFSAAAGIDSHLLANYEHAKAQLNYDAARKIIKVSGVNPRWLALGEDPMILPGYFLPSPEVLEIGKRAVFSAVFDRGLTGDNLEIEPDDDDRRLYLECQFKDGVERWIDAIPTKHLDWFAETFEQVGNLVWARSPRGDGEEIKHRSERLKKRRPYLREIWMLIARHYGRIAKKNEEKKIREGADRIAQLTNSATMPKPSDVKPQWPALKLRLQNASAFAGGKSDLAAFLEVDLTRVSQWLSDAATSREPGAEYALQMLAWVTAQEAKQKSPDRAQTRPGRKTRLRKISHEKPRPSPP